MRTINRTLVLDGRDIASLFIDYEINMKSHTEAPDYEDVVQDVSKEGAARQFWERLPHQAQSEWDPRDLLPFIAEVKE